MKCLATNLFTSQFGCISCVYVCVVIADVHKVVRLVPSAIAASTLFWGHRFLDRKAAAYRKRTTKKLQNGHNIVKITKGKRPKINTARKLYAVLGTPPSALAVCCLSSALPCSGTGPWRNGTRPSFPPTIRRGSSSEIPCTQCWYTSNRCGCHICLPWCFQRLWQ